jgi:hypothetical protein
MTYPCREFAGPFHPHPHIIHVLSKFWAGGKLSHILINISGVLKRLAVVLRCSDPFHVRQVSKYPLATMISANDRNLKNMYKDSMIRKVRGTLTAFLQTVGD